MWLAKSAPLSSENAATVRTFLQTAAIREATAGQREQLFGISGSKTASQYAPEMLKEKLSPEREAEKPCEMGGQDASRGKGTQSATTKSITPKAASTRRDSDR